MSYLWPKQSQKAHRTGTTYSTLWANLTGTLCMLQRLKLTTCISRQLNFIQVHSFLFTINLLTQIPKKVWGLSERLWNMNQNISKPTTGLSLYTERLSSSALYEKLLGTNLRFDLRLRNCTRKICGLQESQISLFKVHTNLERIHQGPGTQNLHPGPTSTSVLMLPSS